jgi:two-component system OmpR family sensor kinase
MNRRWLGPLLLLLVGLVAAVIVGVATANPVFYLRASLSSLIVLVAVLIALAWTAALWWVGQRLGQEQARLARYRSETAEDKRRFLHRLDHELKNPITAIRAGLANVSDAALDPRHQKALASMEAQTVRLSRLTADLRKIAELETRTLERVPVDLSQVLTEVIEVAEGHPDGGERQITLSIPQAPWPLPTIHGDRDLLFLAVYNLVENALKFTKPDDAVELRAREDGRMVILEVADTGPGITAEDQPYVWEELYRGANVHRIAGSGLGLSLVKAVVERHDGHVVLTSRPGKGTLVSIHLPVS